MSASLAETSPDPRFPVGRFKPPASITHEDLTAAISEIDLLPRKLRAAVANLTESQLATPYRSGGWTVAQIVNHLADSHLHSYLRFKLALTELTPTIKPYDQALWAELPDARSTRIEPSLILLEGLHARWAEFLNSLSPEEFERTFIHPEHPEKPLTLAWATQLYAWHSRHHVAHILDLRSRQGW